MTKRQIINKVTSQVKKDLSNEGTGHDWWHIKRVNDLSLRIAKQEKDADLFLVQMIALLHDLDDWKFTDENNALQLTKASRLMSLLNVDKKVKAVILENILKISFKGSGQNVPPSLEGKIVQDADRLDALGAIGIARAFAVGGKYGRTIYNPEVRPQNMSLHPKNPEGTSINHFYEKLLKIKNRLNTKSAKKIAVRRHKFVDGFLQEFFAEWEGER